MIYWTGSGDNTMVNICVSVIDIQNTDSQLFFMIYCGTHFLLQAPFSPELATQMD